MIEIPRSSSLLIKLNNVYDNEVTVNVTSYPFQSIFSTPDYGITVNKKKHESTPIHYLLSEFMHDYSLKFNVLAYNMFQYSQVWFSDDQNDTNVL